MAPALLGPDLFDDVYILELLFLRVIGCDRIDRIDVAASSMVVSHHFHPVVNPTHHDLSRKNIGNHAVIENHMYLAVVFNIIVVGAKIAEIPILRVTGDLMDSCADCLGTDRCPPDGQALLLFQIHGCGQGMTAFAHDGSPARLAPDAVTGGMRPAVRFFTKHPQNLSPGGNEDLAFALNDRRV